MTKTNEQIQQEKEQYFIDENEVRREERLTPSGRFKLLLRYYSTKKGCWNYSRGTIYDLSGKEICDVKRNYSGFHHSFINKNNQEWLVTGRSYMSQTFANLDTGEVFEPSGDQYNGHAFCWAAETLFPDEKTLLVEGCYWAAPYEYKFFDFSDPASGWPELKIINEKGEEDYLCVDQGDHPKYPEFGENSTITVFETSDFYLPLGKYDNDIELEELESLDSDMDDENNWRVDIDQKITLQRQGDRMVIIDRWISPVELDRIQKRKEANEKYQKWEKEFRSTDPLYLEYLEQIKNPKLSPEKYEGRGITYPKWCPDFKEKETRWCRRIVKKEDGKQPYTIDLEWAVKTGPIKLQIFKDGNTHDEKFFGHSAEEMRRAFQYSLDLIS